MGPGTVPERPAPGTSQSYGHRLPRGSGVRLDRLPVRRGGRLLSY
jgi:hypothetical protein